MTTKTAPAHPPNDRRSLGLVPLAPSVVALLLVLPGFALSYFFDDYDFLGRAQTLRLADLLPDPHSLFYRPLSRELYFGIINLLGPLGLLGGHVLNALLFGLAVVLLVRFTSRIAGSRAGLLAGLAFAAFGQAPLLVGWLSGDQDLLAICFILAALNLRAEGRRRLALAAIALAILSKETALAFVPILLGFDVLMGRTKAIAAGDAAGYAVLLLGWAGIHPGIRALLSSATGAPWPSYVGLAQPRFLGSMGKTAVTLSNLPLAGPATPWPAHLSAVLLAAILVSILGVRRAERDLAREPRHSPAPLGRVVALGASMMVLPSLFTSLVVRDWLPYYACIPAVGFSLLVGLALARWPSIAAGAAVVASLVLGVWCRGMTIDPTVTTERTIAESSAALRRVEAGFKTLWPTLPHHANVYVSTQVSGTQSVFVHMNRYQPLRVWYHDPTIRTLTPRRRAAGSGPEFLAWISPTLDVYGVDPVTFKPRSSGPKPELSEYQNAVRNYARGLADAGETDRAVKVMLDLPQADSVSWSLDCRLAAAFFFADRRDSEALDVLSAIPPVDSLTSAREIADLIVDDTAKRQLDPFLMRAHGIQGTLPDLYRRYMRFFDGRNLAGRARVVARKLQAIEPGDRESADVLRRLGSGRPVDRITTPAAADSA